MLIQIEVTNRVENLFKNPIINRVPDQTTNQIQNLVHGLHIIGLIQNLVRGLHIPGRIQDQAQSLAADPLRQDQVVDHQLQDQVQGLLQIEDLLRDRVIIEQDINKYFNYINYGHEQFNGSI